MSGGQTERQVRLIGDFQPDAIMVTPSYMLALLDEMERQGVDPRSTSLKVGVFGAEPWTQDLRREVEERADLHAVDIYGLSEVMGPGVANECVETKDGLHVWEDHFYPEVVDPETGEVLPDGEYGELVFTSLTKEAMPVVRYRTRDLTRLLPGTARSMRRIEKITGRTDDMIILRGVNVFPTQVEELLLRVPGLSPHYQLVLSRPHRMDEMTVRVEARPDCSADERAGLGERLCALVKENIGVTVACDVVEPGRWSARRARRSGCSTCAGLDSPTPSTEYLTDRSVWTPARPRVRSRYAAREDVVDTSTLEQQFQAASTPTAGSSRATGCPRATARR